MIIYNTLNEEHTLGERMYFQGKEQPCNQMFQSELTSQMSNPKKHIIQ